LGADFAAATRGAVEFVFPGIARITDGDDGDQEQECGQRGGRDGKRAVGELVQDGDRALDGGDGQDLNRVDQDNVGEHGLGGLVGDLADRAELVGRRCLAERGVVLLQIGGEGLVEPVAGVAQCMGLACVNGRQGGCGGVAVQDIDEIDHVLAQLEVDGVVVEASQQDVVGDAGIGGLGLEVLLDRLADEGQIAGARDQGLVVFSRKQGLAEPGAGDQRDEGDEDGNGEERCGCGAEGGFHCTFTSAAVRSAMTT